MFRFFFFILRLLYFYYCTHKKFFTLKKFSLSALLWSPSPLKAVGIEACARVVLSVCEVKKKGTYRKRERRTSLPAATLVSTSSWIFGNTGLVCRYGSVFSLSPLMLHRGPLPLFSFSCCCCCCFNHSSILPMGFVKRLITNSRINRRISSFIPDTKTAS